MKSDDIEQLKELVEFLKENEIAEFDLERGDLKVRLKFASAIVPPAASSNVDLAALARLMSAGAGPVAASSGPGYGVGSGIGTLHSQADAGHGHRSDAGSTGGGAPAAQPEETLHIIKSPIVGTFYESPSPGTSAFVTNGDRIEKGQVVCIVEAMKLMNEIEADAAGEIVKRLVNNGQPIEYGQPLFAIRVN